MDGNLCKQYAEIVHSRLASYYASTVKEAALAMVRDALSRELGIPIDTPEAHAFRRGLLSPLLCCVFGELFLTEHAANNPYLLKKFGENNLSRLEAFASEAGKIAANNLQEIAIHPNPNTETAICLQ